MKFRKLIMLSYALFLITGKCFSQDTTKIDDYYIDFSVPDFGAFTLLGTKPEQTTNPGNVKEFSASVLNIISAGSKISPGIAIDWSPYQTFGKKSFQIKDYKKYFLWRGLQTTLGTVADSNGTKMGLGIKWTFIDQSDPLLDDKFAADLNKFHHDMFVSTARTEKKFLNNRQSFLKALELSRDFSNMEILSNSEIMGLMDSQDDELLKKEVMLLVNDIKDKLNAFLVSKNKNILTSTELERIITLCEEMKKINELDTKLDKELLESFLELKKEWKKQNWNCLVLTAGAGWVFNSSDNKWNSLKSQLFKSYINGKFPIGKMAQFAGIASFGMLPKDNVNDSTILSNFFIGGRFLIGNANNRFSIDAGYKSSRAEAALYDQKELALNLGFEFKITDGVYLELACGFQGLPSKLFSSSNILSFGSFKYAFNKNQRFKRE